MLTAKFTTRLTPLCLSVMSLMVCSSLYAANETNTQTDVVDVAQPLNKIVVKGKTSLPYQTEKSNSYTTSSMRTTTGLDLSPKETPQSVSAITQQQLKNRGVTSISDALKQTTGINVIQDSGRYRFQSRGFYIDQIEEDGMSSTMPGSASNPYRTSSSSNSLDIYDHIEVLRGASGLTQGNSEPGGTINAVRKHPTEDFQMQGYVQAGSWNNIRSMVDVSGGLNQDKTIRGRFVAAGASADSFKNDVSSDDRLLYGVMDFDLDPSTLLRIGAMYEKTNTQPDYFGVPMGLNGKDTGLSSKTYLGADWNKLASEKYNTFAELEHIFNDDWKISTKVNANFNNSEQKIAGLAQLTTSYLGLSNDNPTLKTNNKQFYNNESKELTANINLTGKYHLFGNTHDLFAIASYSRLNETSDWKRVLDTTAYNVWTFNPSMISQPDWSNDSILFNDIQYKNQSEQKAITLGTRFNLLNNVHLLTGGRYTEYDYQGSTYYRIYNYVNDGEYDKSNYTKNKFIPYAGLTYDITPQTSAYVSHTEIFKPQSATNAAGQVLDPIVGKNDEIGLKSAFFNNRLNTSIALFQIEQENRPLYVASTSSYVEDGKVRSRGVDVEISGQITPQLNLFTGYTFNKSKYLETESTTYAKGTNFSKHTPEHMFRLSSQYQFSGDLAKWSAGVGVSAQTDTSSLYNIHQGGYTLWNGNIRYEFSPKLSVNLIGENLTNKRYYENQRTRMEGGNNFFGTPRSALLRVDWKY